MPQAAAPGPAPTSATPAVPDKPKGAIGIWIGVLLIIGGVVLGVLLVVSGAKSLIDGFDDLERVSIAGGGIVEIDDIGTQTIYAERSAPGSGSGFNTSTYSGFGPDITVQVIGPDGQEIDVRSVTSSETYTYDGYQGVAIGEFTAPTEGDYRIIPSGADGAGIYTTIAVGKGLQLGGIGAILGGVFGGGLVVLIGIIVIIVFAVRRSRSKKRIAQAQAPYPSSYAPAGAGWPAAPGYAASAGYGAPGYGPPGYGAPAAPSAPAPGAWPAATNPGWVPPPVAQPGPGGPGPTWSPPPPPGQQPPPPPSAPSQPWQAPAPAAPQPWQPPAADAPGPPAPPADVAPPVDPPADLATTSDAPPPPPPPSAGGDAPS